MWTQIKSNSLCFPHFSLLYCYVPTYDSIEISQYTAWLQYVLLSALPLLVFYDMTFSITMHQLDLPDQLCFIFFFRYLSFHFQLIFSYTFSTIRKSCYFPFISAIVVHVPMYDIWSNFFFQKRTEEVVRFLCSLLHSLVLVSLIIVTFGWSYSSLVLQVCVGLLEKKPI